MNGHKKHKTVAIQYREAIITAFKEEWNWKLVAKSCNVKIDTARRLIKRWLKTGKIAPNKTGGANNVKVTPEMLSVLEDLADDHADWTLFQFANELMNEGFPLVTGATIRNHLNKMLFTVKKVYYDKSIRNHPATKQKRKAFAEWLIENFERYHFIWIDETGFDLHLTRTRGWGRVGMKTLQCTLSNQRGHHLSHTMAVSGVLGLVHDAIQFGGVGKAQFQEFIVGLVEKLNNLPTEKPYCLIFDNAPCHAKIEEFMEEAGFSMDSQRTSPYSPELNAVENVFSFYKADLKLQLRVSGPVESGRFPGETLTECRKRKLVTFATNAAQQITPAKLLTCQTCLFIKRCPKAQACEDM